MKSLLTKSLTVILVFAVIFFVVDKIIMPYLVSADEYQVPNVVGLHKNKAIEIIERSNLEPIINRSRYDEFYPKDHVIFQNPRPNTVVKAGRKIYLTVSGGLQKVQMPFLINKSVRDARITLERMGLQVDTLIEVESELPAGTIAEQEYTEGVSIPVGTKVKLKVSIGPQIGKVRVPRLIGKSLSEAEAILKRNSLRIGFKTYIHSSNYLPNTVVDQQPSENSLVSVGDSVNVVLIQN
ncbi:PASTA domain-containing protein [Melioribacter sp. OK-6-Me]|uniref:PASTA domain-containing protein n=1 Tax=unclassified Melioribacter TaxID=2627329 RepID=UPI003EDAEA66